MPNLKIIGVELIVLSFVVSPIICVLLSAFFAAILMVAEEWEFMIAFWYVSANISGMPNPFVTASPTKTIGQCIDLLVSCNAMVFSSTVVGMAGMLTFVSYLPDSFNLRSMWRGAFALVIAIPLCVTVCSAGLGGILALVEEWSWWDGFRFIMGTACGLGTPLVSVRPVSTPGRLLCVVIGIAFQGMVGVIVGITGGIGVIVAGVENLEAAVSCGKGKSDEEISSGTEGNKMPSSEVHIGGSLPQNADFSQALGAKL